MTARGKQKLTYSEGIAILKAKYGKNRKNREAINAAIRAECPGGDDALDALELFNKLCNRLGWEAPGSDEPSVQMVAYKRLLDIVDAMEDDVRQRWGLPERPEREDLRR